MAEESRELRRNRAIRRLRRVVLVAAVLAIAGVTALYVLRRSGPVPEPEDDFAAGLEPSGELVTVGEGFERTFSEGDRPVFTVSGDKYAVDREGIVRLEGVTVEVYQEDGSSYRVEGARGRFDVEKQEGRLTGGVTITTPSGVAATMDQLHVRERGRLLASQGPDGGLVRLALEDAYEGSAEKLWIHPNNRLLHLRGEVDLRGVGEGSEGFRLKATNLLLDLNRNTVQADGAAILRRPGEIVRARRIVAFLAKETRAIRFVRARWDVWARLNRRGALAGVDPSGGAEDGDGGDGGSELSRVIVQCEDLGLLLGGEGQTARELEIQDGPRGVATLTAIDVGDTRRHVLEAPRITADLEDGRPVSAVAEGGVVLTAPGGDGEGAGAGQRTTGDRATAAFDAEGVLATVELTGNVSLVQGTLEAIGQRGVFHVREDRGELTGGVVVTDEDLEATGERGTFDVGEDSGTLFGRPAVVTTPRGRMEAPEVRYSGAEGLVHGTGGVRARLDEAEGSALDGSPLARGDGPVRVQAEEGFFRDQPRGFLFRGAVRAWRGDDLVVADELRGDEAAGRVVATGDVRTLFHPEASDEDDPEPEPATDGEGGEPRLADAPLEVESEELVYRRQERLLVYTGDVTALQEGRTVTCREMVVELAESGGTGEVTCTGDVEVVEPVEGRTLTGHRAVYDPESRTILVTAAEGG
ncbi:MAG TPA: LptA/OstA family protein, partial [Thermoanaerobaculia bacterium]